MFSGTWRIFWHFWEHINSGDTSVLRFAFIFFWQWHRLADFSLLWKCCPKSAVFLSVHTNSHNCILYRENHSMKAYFWKDPEPIGPVWYFLQPKHILSATSAKIFRFLWLHWVSVVLGSIAIVFFSAKKVVCLERVLKKVQIKGPTSIMKQQQTPVAALTTTTTLAPKMHFGFVF